jgi:hypothetical protein
MIGLLLGRTRLLTLSGAVGVGKTRLPIQALYGLLETVPNGVGFADTTLVPTTIAAARRPRNQQREPLRWRTAQSFSARRPSPARVNPEPPFEQVATPRSKSFGQLANAIFLIIGRQALDMMSQTSPRVPSLSAGPRSAVDRTAR